MTEQKGCGVRTFALLLLLVFVFRCWFAGTLPLSGDEAYHWEWSRHLAAGYYDHPGLTAYLIHGSTALFGRSTEFTVRFPAILLSILNGLLAYGLARRIGRELGRPVAATERASFLAGTMLLILPLPAAFGVYMSTDPAMLSTWLLALDRLWEALRRGFWRDWLLAGAAVGLAFFSKFLAFLLPAGVLLFLVLRPAFWRWLASPRPYVAAAVALLVWSPFLLWNAEHGWATFAFNFVRRQSPAPFELGRVLEYVGGQGLALSPLVFVGCLALLWWVPRYWRHVPDVYAYLVSTALVSALYFLWVSFEKRVGLHWPAPGWTGAVVALACVWAMEPGWLPRLSGRRYVRWALGTALGLTLAVHAVVHVPQAWVVAGLPPEGEETEKRSRESAERYGWRELGVLVDRWCDELRDRDGREVFLLGSEYGLAANLAFYTPGQPATHLWTKPRIHGENYRFWDDFGALQGQSAVYVTKTRSNARGAVSKLREHFAEVQDPEVVPIVVGGVPVREFFLVRCRGFDGRTPRYDDQR